MPDAPDHERVASANGPAAVALVELYEHHEVVDYLCGALPPERDVALFVSPYVADRLSPRVRTRAAAVTVVDVRRRAAVIGERRAELERFGICVLVTLGLDVGLADAFCALRTARVLVVHDARFHFAPQLELVGTIPAALRRLRYRLRGAWAERLQADRGWDGFVVGSGPMRHFLIERGVNAPVLDVAYVRGPDTPAPRLRARATLRVGVPGTINLRSREYADLLAAAIAGFDRPVTWVFPSRAVGRAAARWLRRFGRAVAADPSQRLVYLAGEGDYDAALVACDVLVLPLRRRMVYAGQYEIGGVTKISGTENDQLRVGRPALLRSGYVGRGSLGEQQLAYADAPALSSALAGFDASAFPPFSLESPGATTARWARFLEAVRS